MSIKVLDSVKTEDVDKLKEQFAIDVLKGFSTKQKYLSSKYFYDDEGSRLFSEIMNSEDYYLTGCEIDVFQRSKASLAKMLKGSKFDLVELGAGDGRKTKILIEEFRKHNLEFDYIPIDISEGALKTLEALMKDEFEGFDPKGIVGDYADALSWLSAQDSNPKVVLFLGSTIGNFDRSGALVFLRVLWRQLNAGDKILIGFDLKKDLTVLNRAYNDSRGVTKQFNLNILTRMNNELGANFDLNKFMHFGSYNPLIGAMESYLISTEKQSIYIEELEKTFTFKAFEPILLEYSNKYLIEDVEFYAKETGFTVLENFFDSKKYYLNSFWEVIKE